MLQMTDLIVIERGGVIYKATMSEFMTQFIDLTQRIVELENEPKLIIGNTAPTNTDDAWLDTN